MTCFSTCFNKTPYAYTPNLLQTSMSCAPTPDRKRWPCVSVLFWTLITTRLRLQVKSCEACINSIKLAQTAGFWLTRFDVHIYRKPQVLRPCPGCLHHALLSPGKPYGWRNCGLWSFYMAFSQPDQYHACFCRSMASSMIRLLL